MRTSSVVADGVKQIQKAHGWLWVTGKEQPQVYPWAGWSSYPLKPDPSIMKASRCLVHKAQKGKRCIPLFCLTKAPFMFSWNKTSVVWFTYGCAAEVLKCRFCCNNPSEITVSWHLVSPSSRKIVPCAFLWSHNSLEPGVLQWTQPLLNSGLSGLLWHPGGPLQQVPLLHWGHLGFRMVVKCCGNEAVWDLSPLTPLAVTFSVEK